MSLLWTVLVYCLKVLPTALCAYASDLSLIHGPPKFMQKFQFSKAILDNVLGHGLVAFFLWLAVLDYNLSNRWHCFECFLSFFIGSVIDIDHFIMARSLNLHNALNLSSRPMFHNTSLLVLFLPIHIFIWSLKNKDESYHNLLLICETAILSHHIRDANRRGMWLWPFGNTPPIRPSWIYISLIAILPIAVWYVKKLLKKRLFESSRIIDIV